MTSSQLPPIQLSVIVPVWRAEEYLAQCLSSILLQDIRDMEVLAVIDGAELAENATSLAICQRLAAEDIRLRILEVPAPAEKLGGTGSGAGGAERLFSINPFLAEKQGGGEADGGAGERLFSINPQPKEKPFSINPVSAEKPFSINPQASDVLGGSGKGCGRGADMLFSITPQPSPITVQPKPPLPPGPGPASNPVQPNLLPTPALPLPPAPAGPVAARLAGLHAARGRWISFVDADDYVLPASYHPLLIEAERADVDMLIFGWCALRNKPKPRPQQQALRSGLYTHEELSQEIWPRMLFTGTRSFRALTPAVWNKLYRREFAVQIFLQVPQHLRVAEDLLSTCLCLLSARRVLALPQQYAYVYRQRLNSLSTTGQDCYLQHLREAVQLIQYSAPSVDLDLTSQVAANIAYAAVRSIFLCTLGQRSLRATYHAALAHARKIYEDSALHTPLHTADFSRFFPVYRFCLYLLRRGCLRLLALFSLSYPLAARIKGEAF